MWRISSTVTKNCEAKLCIERTESPLSEDVMLAPDEVVIKVEAAPINPSDLGAMLPYGTDIPAILSKTTVVRPVDDAHSEGLAYQIDKKFEGVLKGRMDRPSSCGNEGAGVVVKTGSSEQAKKLLGKVVAGFGGRMYAQYKKLKVYECIVHNEGTTAAEAASSYINPMTVLAMVDTMRRENHSAIVHTAAASNLGQMLQKLCNQENIPLINIVRKPEQETILREIGAKYVVRSDLPDKEFMDSLTAALIETKATLCYDAIGGGNLASKILHCMELAATKFTSAPIGVYGTDVSKQLYVYGGLDRSPTMLSRTYGLSWQVGGYLMPRVLAKLPAEDVQKMYKAVADNIKTVFASEYYKEVSLAEAVQPQNFVEYIKQETGKKFLILPNKNIENLDFKL